MIGDDDQHEPIGTQSCPRLGESGLQRTRGTDPEQHADEFPCGEAERTCPKEKTAHTLDCITSRAFLPLAIDCPQIDIERQWVVEPGTFHIMVGGSSKDIRLRGELTVR